ncbi:anthrone oxygenase family protein [Phytoactinopolyspora halotolerans]|uniref:DUF1772 domain-containing protein n=1 Tax=Phytoactinopolyspora halotolerans TaxID=1981512 RepID=A0A6L9SB68_9ACTN|nr:DUF1772 domain-containing protein [Phytoactinopolyspora halotolerans]NEE02516.1 DUF1772 domain-containing protein [Phytoactinopolyspora halotolerans]
MTTGLTAGVFADWSNAIMPGLREVDDRTFVTAFRSLDSAITNPLFLGVGFMGALILTGLALVLHLVGGHRRASTWIGLALILYLAVLVITFGVHEPLNASLREVAEPTSAADFTAARARLEEASWTAWNTVRAAASIFAFGCLAWAVAIHRQQVCGPRSASWDRGRPDAATRTPRPQS